MKRLPLFLVLLASGMSGVMSGLAHADPVVDRMRDQLRQTITQMRQLEDENLSLKAKLANAAPAKPAPVAAPKVNTAELQQLRSAAQRESERADGFQTRVSELTAKIEQLQQSLAQAGTAARGQQQAAQSLDSQLKAAGQKTQLCENSNKQLAALTTELLDNYRQKGVWQAMRIHEPVTGLYKVKLENLVQDYQSKIADASVANAAPVSSSTTP